MSKKKKEPVSIPATIYAPTMTASGTTLAQPGEADFTQAIDQEVVDYYDLSADEIEELQEAMKYSAEGQSENASAFNYGATPNNWSSSWYHGEWGDEYKGGLTDEQYTALPVWYRRNRAENGLEWVGTESYKDVAYINSVLCALVNAGYSVPRPIFVPGGAILIFSRTIAEYCEEGGDWQTEIPDVVTASQMQCCGAEPMVRTIQCKPIAVPVTVDDVISGTSRTPDDEPVPVNQNEFLAVGMPVSWAEYWG